MAGLAGRHPLPQKEAVESYREELKDEIDFWKFLQYKFYQRWENSAHTRMNRNLHHR